MSALAVFTCRPNSHPFQERHVSVHEPVKIGRSVARARPAQNNAIFDCKVLSRNHALLWYENSKFYLQDTKSSNGTFINNQRLSKGSEESPPREIYSGDVVQFGVDVMENSRRGKVTHGCIIASITLYHPDGSECKPSQSSPFLNAPAGAAGMQCQELYQLAQCLQEALHREQMLESKLAALQRLVQSTQEASETGWQAFMDEDRLLSRLEVLENQLSTYSKNQSEDTLRQELVALQDDKLKYETTAKESLRKVLQEKLEAVTKLTDLESSLSNTGEECTHLKEMCEMSQKELEQLAEKHQEQLEEITGLQNKLQEVERDHKEECELIEKEKSDLQARLDEMMKQEESLNAKVEALQADNDFTKEQLANMKVRLETMKENSADSELTKTEELGVQVDIALIEQVAADTQQELQDEKDQELDSPSPSEDKLKETQLQIEDYKAQLKESDSRLQESKEKIENLQSDLELAQKEAAASMTKMNELEKNFKLSDVHVDVMLENTVADLKLQLEESRKQASSSEELISTLKDQVERLERELSLQRESSQGQSYETNSNSIPTTSNHVDQNHLSNHYREEIERLKELLEDAKGSVKKTESNAEKYKGDLKAAQCDMKALSEEMNQLRSQLINREQQAKDSDDHVRSLTDELEKADFTTKEVKEHILVLRDQLIEEQEVTRESQNEAQRLQRQLEEEQESHQEHCQQLQEVKGQLHDAQEQIRQSREEAEQLRIKLQEVQDEKEMVHATRASELAEVPNGQHGGTELSKLKDECSRLKTRIQDIEKEMKLSRTENNNLRSEYNKLQESYRELEALKDHLEHEQDDWQNNLTDAQKSAEQSKLLQATAEINRLKEHCSVCEDQVKALKTDYDDLNNDFQFLAYKSRTLSYCAMLPLLMLLLAFLLAMYPFLASVTATTLPT